MYHSHSIASGEERFGNDITVLAYERAECSLERVYGVDFVGVDPDIVTMFKLCRSVLRVCPVQQLYGTTCAASDLESQRLLLIYSRRMESHLVSTKRTPSAHESGLEFELSNAKRTTSTHLVVYYTTRLRTPASACARELARFPAVLVLQAIDATHDVEYNVELDACRWTFTGMKNLKKFSRSHERVTSESKEELMVHQLHVMYICYGIGSKPA